MDEGFDEFDEMGPIDYVVVEFPETHLTGSMLPLLLDLVERGLVRVLDLVFVTKGADGTVAGVELSDLAGEDETIRAFAGASSGLLDDGDVADAAEVLAPGSSAALLVWENRWAAPFAREVRRSGGQLVASGRIPVQGILAALERVEAG